MMMHSSLLLTLLVLQEIYAHSVGIKSDLHCSGPTDWILQEENVCYGMGRTFKGKTPLGEFTIKGNHTLLALRLVHKSGDLACTPFSNIDPARWGYRKNPCNSNCFSTVVQFKNGTFLEKILAMNSKFLLDYPGFTIDDDVLMVKGSSWPIHVKDGEGFQIMSMNNGLCTETGIHCVDVEASFLP